MSDSRSCASFSSSVCETQREVLRAQSTIYTIADAQGRTPAAVSAPPAGANWSATFSPTPALCRVVAFTRPGESITPAHGYAACHVSATSLTARSRIPQAAPSAGNRFEHPAADGAFTDATPVPMEARLHTSWQQSAEPRTSEG